MAVLRDEMVPDDAAPPPDDAPRERISRWRLAAAAIVLLLVAAIVAGWIARERLLRDYLVEQIRRAGLPATFRVVSVGTGRQVLADVVVGDPAHPDLTIARIEVSSASRFGIPGLGQIRLVRPRFRGSYRDGVLSFGSLDKLLFGPSRTPVQPFRLPDMALVLDDARGTIVLDRGTVAVSAAGTGNLRDGFAGRLSANAPTVSIAGCDARGFKLDARLAMAGGKPRLTGPLQLAALACPEVGASLAAVGVDVDAATSAAFDAVDGRFAVRGADARFPGGGGTRAVHGTVTLAYGPPGTTARYDLAADALTMPQASARTASIAGLLRAPKGSGQTVIQGSVSANGIVPGRQVEAALARATRATTGTFAAPLLARLHGALRREGPASVLSGDYLLRREPGRLALVVPRLEWRAQGGASLLSLARVQVSADAGAPASLSGTFRTGGPGMPQLAGTLERSGGEGGGRGGFTLNAAMARYDAGSASAALPRLTIVGLGGSGTVGIAGEARISGPLPGGEARGLVLPISGNWNARGGLSLWPRCVAVGFESLRFANLTFDARRLELCPPAGRGMGAIVRSDARGMRIAVGVPSLTLTGRLGATPIALRTGAVGFAVPGALTARAVDIALGPADAPSRFTISRLDARIADDIAGSFAGSQIRLAAVPLDLVDAAGRWRYADGRLTIANGALRVVDREAVARFQPLTAREATLTLADNRIVADAALREPASDRTVLRTHIVHDLAHGQGSAGLFVDALTFDKQVQPDTLTRLALGVIANAAGTVRGTGQIDWNAQRVTSGGRFGTDALDFAAAFGPVKGASGTIVFTDLLGLVTAPRQTLRVASVNPGIEATDGVITYALLPDHVLAVEGGRWPFLGGTLTLEPARMTIGAAETRHFALTIEALDAARLIQQMDLENLAVTGVFDGRLPLVIDQDGSRIEGGTLRSRPPGGNVSYVGALTYKDLSTMANFAFDALRSLDYGQMRVSVDGALTGELVTRLQFSGVTQGAGAKRNFLTERIARLPIQFNVNLRAPFVQLISSFRSLWDPAFIRDPREIGLIAPDGTRMTPQVQHSASEPVR